MLTYLQHLNLDRGNSVQYPVADLRVPALLYRIIIFSGTEERGSWIDIPLIENRVNCHREEVTES